MKFAKYLTTTCLLLVIFSLTSTATDLKITHVTASHSDVNDRGDGFSFVVSWDNSWHNDRNFDAAWVFLKFQTGNGYQHAYLKPGSAEMIWKESNQMPDAGFEVSENGAGMMIYPSEEHRGRVSYRVFVEMDTSRVDIDRWLKFGNYDHLLGYGIEMVYISEGRFTLGDPSDRVLQEGAFYRSDRNGERNGLYEITSADQVIEVGPNRGNLYYQVDQAQYQGDQRGPILASYPNGYGAFYLMKYEITQGDYATFLNSINTTAQAFRANFGSTEYSTLGGTIRLNGDGQYLTDTPRRRNVFMAWDDMMAFYDWAGMRPYTELEYTKAARGPLEPQPLEYAWNTTSKDDMLRRIDPRTHAQTMLNSMDESQLTEQNRELFGASYYWVMDLSGSMWEKVVTVGDSVGRAFTGIHGDGFLGYGGDANVEGWPSGNFGSFGYGYRGGGYYGKADLYDRNPFNLLAFRRYGAWSGGPRNSAYGGRGAVTAR